MITVHIAVIFVKNVFRVYAMRLKTLFIALLLLFIGNVMADEMTGKMTIPADKEMIQFNTRLGTVTFAHKKHAELSITQCTTCHHKQQPDSDVIKPCHDCHQHDSTNPQKASSAFHTRCTGCHKDAVAEGHEAGPLKTKCKLCHIKE